MLVNPRRIMILTLTPGLLQASSGFSSVSESPHLNVSTTRQVEHTSNHESQPAVILPPSRAGGPEKLLIIFPGMKKSPSEYVSLAREIQQASPYRLWIGILKFTGDLVNPPQAESSVDYVFDRVKSEGFSSVAPDNTTVAGHSLGGIVAQYFVNKKNYKGLILLSSYLERSEGNSSLPQAELPVLILSGELDGQTRITRVAFDAKSMISPSASGISPEKKLVIILKGINHAQFAGGEPARSDLRPEVDYAQAQKKIAAVISDFQISIDETPEFPSETAAAIRRLGDNVAQTRDILTPYWKAQKLDKDWCAETQKFLLPPSVAPENAEISQVVHTGSGDFASSKPKAVLNSNGKLEITVHSAMTYHPNLIDRSTIPEAAQNLACKNKNSEWLALQTGTTSPTKLSCSSHNQRIYSWALEQVSPAVRERFLRRGRQLRFADDKTFASGLQWVPSRLGFENHPTERIATVTSKALYTDSSAPFGLGGMHYCKLLSPTRTMEWILVDGLRE
jgi:hypothetical protein